MSQFKPIFFYRFYLACLAARSVKKYINPAVQNIYPGTMQTKMCFTSSKTKLAVYMNRSW